ncbi:hypothetical protein DYQ93_11410 [Xanthomonas sp. LMG 8992]|uniref:hypothetical protein n=1 Tax=Xanthomonas sp. LMG 8992 TaxID=1591157 RepID=UPI00136BC463|nr:hypothetical protein [Xanthomonas sp. LMG 8992]MXV11627.1 hypothetical protein [Xanthomonas sp. LMG 8992]
MSGTRHKSLHLCIKSAGAPSDAQLAAIRTYTLADMPAEKLYVRSFVVAHNAIDRDDECFDEALLADFARTLPGKGLFVKHPSGWDGDSGPGKGRWFGAKLERMSVEEARTLLREPALSFPPGVDTAVLLMGDAYLVRTASNADMLDEMDAGIVGDVSLGFVAKSRQPLVDDQGHELTARRLLGPGEALEASLVWLGAQPGARAIKSAKTTPENDVNLQEQLDAEKAAHTATKSALSAAQPAHDIVVKARAALGAHAALLDDPDRLAEVVKAADAHRVALVDQIIAGERHAGLLGDDEESVAAAKAIHMGERLERLQQLAGHYGKRAPSGGRMAPSDPNARTPQDTAQAKGVFATNPAFGGRVGA